MNWNAFFGRKIKVFGFFLFVLFITYNFFLRDSFTHAKYDLKSITTAKTGDIYIGDKKAKDTCMLIFGFGCYHCREFLKKELRNIADKMNNKKGKLFIIRQLPESDYALRLFTLLHCGHNSDVEKVKIINLFIENFSDIAKSKNFDNSLYELFKKNNLRIDNFYACLSRNDLRQQGIKNIQDEVKSGVKVIPLVIINNNIANLSGINTFLKK